MSESKESGHEGRINNPEEAASFLVEEFTHLKDFEKEVWAEPPSEKYHTDENQAMAEDDASRFRIEKREDLFADDWREEIDPIIKEATIRKLLDMGREDVVQEIARFNDISSFVNAETLKKIRG